MNCKECKNYEPKVSKPTTTVTVWACKGVIKNLEDECRHIRPYFKGHYSFSGKPDIDRVIHKTLDEGALAIKVECTERFCTEYVRHDSPTQYCVYLWKKEISTNGFYGWENNNIPELRGSFCTADACVDKAIIEYLAKQEPKIKVGDIVRTTSKRNSDDLFIFKSIDDVHDKHNYELFDVNEVRYWGDYNDLRKATPDEVYEWFTKEVDGNKYIAYEKENGLGVCLVMVARDNIHHAWHSTPFIHYMNWDRNSPLVDSFIKHHNIPVMPYTWLQAIGGEMRYPKKEGE